MLAKTDGNVHALCGQLKQRLGDMRVGETERRNLLNHISDWLREEADEFTTGTVIRQRALLMIVRILMRWTKLSDNLNGFMDVILEGVLSSFFQVSGATA